MSTRRQVAILEADAGVGQRLGGAVRSDPSLELVAVESRAEAIVKLAAARELDVVLVGTGLPEGHAVGVIRKLLSLGRDIRCVALTNGRDIPELVGMFAAGATGCLPKAAVATTVTDAIREASGRHLRLPRELAQALFGGVALTLGKQADSPRAEQDAAEEAAYEARVATIRQIIDQQQFEMVFQPIVALADGRLVGLEALARFTTEERRSPDVWLEEASAVGLRADLELGLLGAALAQCPALPEDAFLTVNLSPDTARSEALGEVIGQRMLGRVVVEITDHRQLSDYGVLGDALADLRSRGLRIAIDDSGHGLSSLGQLVRLLPDFIKLNRTLTRDIDRDSTRRALAFALATIASEGNAQVIAEGIETTAELEVLRELGIPHGQGYLIAAPAPPEECLNLSVEVLQGRSSAASEAPRCAIDLPGGTRRGMREAAGAVFGLLAKELPDSAFVVAMLDHEARRWRVVAAHDEVFGRLEHGLNVPLDQAPCYHMARGDGPRLCGDMELDEVYGGLSLPRDLGAVSYVGLPLDVHGAQGLATIAALSRRPDQFGQGDLDMLAAMGELVLQALSTELVRHGGAMPRAHLRELATKDPLTGALNGPSFLQAAGARSPKNAFLVHAHVASAETLVNRCGRAVADMVVRSIEQAMVEVAEPTDLIGRVGEVGVATLLTHRTADQVEALRGRVDARVRRWAEKQGLSVALRVEQHAWDPALGERLVASRAAVGAAG
jgi:EAL domain-containing protein (putative c-di-GMP-specific phosphodiesterase class I)/DNA-binding NarL/FixJ family response regulator/GGDEF domain-containing protein